MKKIFIAIILFFVSLNSSYAGFFEEFFDATPKIQYCKDWECWINKWTESVKWVNWIVTDRKFSQYVQDVIKYILTFVFIIAVIYIIYAWFNLLISAWDESKAKNSKSIIIYVIIWIVIIYLAYSIVLWIMNVLWVKL